MPKSTPLPPAPGAPREGAGSVVFRNGSRGIPEQLQAQGGADISSAFSSLLTMGSPVIAPNRGAFQGAPRRVYTRRDRLNPRNDQYHMESTFDQTGYDRAQAAYQSAINTLGSTPSSVSLGDGLLISTRR